MLPKCWAAELGSCSEKISREHLVSRALFAAPKVRVQGLPWCKGEPKEIGIESATGKILCKTHNSELSAIDQEAGALAKAARAHMRLSSERAQQGGVGWNQPIVRLELRAKRL